MCYKDWVTYRQREGLKVVMKSGIVKERVTKRERERGREKESLEW